MGQYLDLDQKSISLEADSAFDEPLTMIERRLRELYRSAAASENDELIARIGREIDDLEAEICPTVPRTIAGIAVKVRHLWHCAQEQAEGDDELNVRTILESLCSLAEQAEGDDELAFGSTTAQSESSEDSITVS